MKQVNINLMQILQDYGSLTAYNEEQHRCGLAQIKDELTTKSLNNVLHAKIAPTIDLNQAPKHHKPIKLFGLQLFPKY